MSELAHLSIMPQPVFAARQEAGMLAPMHDTPRIVDCGDFRPATDPHLEQRQNEHGPDTTTARFFGAGSGIAMSGLIAIAAQVGEREFGSLVKDYGPDLLTNFATSLQERVGETSDIALHQHSDEAKEGNPYSLARDHDHDDDLGCKFATFAGMILANATNEAVLLEAQAVASLTGQHLPLEDVARGAKIVQTHLAPGYAVTRAGIRPGVEGGLPFVVLKAVPEETAGRAKVIYDLAGFQSSAQDHLDAGTPRFHHTPEVARIVLAEMPEFNVDPNLLDGSALLLGPATRFTLSGPQNPNGIQAKIIPREYRSYVSPVPDTTLEDLAVA